MLLLAIDTSGKHGSIALAQAGERSADLNDVELIETVPLAGGTFSAQLVPQIAALLSSHGFTKREIGAFAPAPATPITRRSWASFFSSRAERTKAYANSSGSAKPIPPTARPVPASWPRIVP
jgi:hypothetical protein